MADIDFGDLAKPVSEKPKNIDFGDLAKPVQAAPSDEIAPQKGSTPESRKTTVEAPSSWGEKALGAAQTAYGAITAPIVAGARVLGGKAGEEWAGRQFEGPSTPGSRQVQENIGTAAESSGLNKLGAVAPMLHGMQMPRISPGAAEYAAGKAGKIGEALTPAIPPETLDLARKAQAAGIPLRPDMLTNSKLLRMIGDTLEQVPLSGNKGVARQTAFNQAATEMIGGDSKSGKLTPDVFRKAITSSGEKIGDLSEKYPISATPKFHADLDEIAKNSEFETSDTGRVVMKYINEIKSKINPSDNTIDGTTFRKIRSQLTAQMRRSQNMDVTHALSDVDDVMLDHIKTQLNSDELAEFNKARQQYSDAKVLEPLVAKGQGDISPSGLMAQVTSSKIGKASMAKGTRGYVGDLARIGQRFLNEPQPPRQAAYGVLGELGAGAVAPGATAGVVGAANLYNRAAPYLAKKILAPGSGL